MRAYLYLALLEKLHCPQGIFMCQDLVPRLARTGLGDEWHQPVLVASKEGINAYPQLEDKPEAAQRKEHGIHTHVTRFNYDLA